MRVPWYLMAKGKGGGGYKTASGPIVSVNDALAAPLRSLLVRIEPVQAGTGDPSPDNVRPISGWSAVNVWRTGKNLCEGTTNNLISISENAASVINGTGTCLYAHLVKGQTYAFSNPTMNRRVVSYWDRLPSVGDTTPYYQVENPFTAIKTGLALIYICNSAVDTSEAQLELGSIATPYAPYSGNQYTIQLGQTVYGGTLDVTNGVLTVDRAEVDLGTLSWGDGEWRSNCFFTTDLTNKKSTVSGAISSQYILTEAGFASMNNGTMRGTSSNLAMWVIVDERYTDAATFTAAMSGVQLVYELATPITIPLTPQEISTLQGQNNVWADTGDVTVEYLASGGANADLMKLAVAFMGR